MNESLRIGMVCPYSLSRPGGVQGQVQGLARSLRTKGHDVTVLAPADGVLVGADPSVEIVGRTVGLRSNGSVAPVSLSPGAARHVRRWAVGADVMHLHEPMAPLVGYGCLLRRPTALVGTYHRSGDSAWYRVLAPAARWAEHRLDVSCAVSEAARMTASKATGATPEILFNGVELGRITSVEPWPAARPAILFLGRHEHRKGLGVLLEAFGAVSGDVELWIAGDGPTSVDLRKWHPASDRVQWLGVLDDADVARRLMAATVLCAPSLFGESFGMVLLEGMAASCTVIASDIPGYRDAAGGHAILVPPNDPGTLAGALKVAIEAAPDIGRPGLPDAYDHAARWSMTLLAERYEDVYRQAIERRAGSLSQS